MGRDSRASAFETGGLLRDILAEGVRRLAAAGCETPRLDAEVLLAYALAKDRTWLYLHPHQPLGRDEAGKFWRLLARRESREPVAYITGSKEFFGLDFRVNRHVLIPRPETELLVETALQIIRDNPRQAAGLTVADVGTGSGCIAVALAKMLPNSLIYALDISAEALAVARQNAVDHGVAGRIIFLQGDLLRPLAGPVDLVVSNPPYVSQADLSSGALLPEVLQYEPHLALDGGEAGLAVIARLLPHARARLKPGGSLLVEIGADQGQASYRLAAAHFPRAAITIKTDLAGRDRLLVVTRPAF